MESEPIVQRLRAHCPDAWAVFYRAEVKAVWRFSHRRLGGRRDAADEVVSDTFLAAVESIRRYDPAAGSLEGWLFGIARRKVADRLRATYRQRLRIVDEPLESLPEPHSRNDDGEATRDRVSVALAQLPALHRDALIWAYQDGLTVAQLTERLHRSEKATENLLYRARQRFKGVYREVVRGEERNEAGHERRTFAGVDR